MYTWQRGTPNPPYRCHYYVSYRAYVAPGVLHMQVYMWALHVQVYVWVLHVQVYVLVLHVQVYV